MHRQSQPGWPAAGPCADDTALLGRPTEGSGDHNRMTVEFEAGRRFVLIQGNEMVQRVLRLTRLDERLEIVADPSDLAAA